MPIPKFLPGTQGNAPQFFQQLGATGDYRHGPGMWEIIRNGTKIAWQYNNIPDDGVAHPPGYVPEPSQSNGGVGPNGGSWSAAIGTSQSSPTVVNIPTGVIYAPDDIFVLRMYEAHLDGIPGSSKQYQFGIDGPGSDGGDVSGPGGDYPDCVKASGTGTWEVLKGSYTKSVSPFFGSELSYDVELAHADGGHGYICLSNGTWTWRFTPEGGGMFVDYFTHPAIAGNNVPGSGWTNLSGVDYVPTIGPCCNLVLSVTATVVETLANGSRRWRLDGLVTGVDVWSIDWETTGPALTYPASTNNDVVEFVLPLDATATVTATGFDLNDVCPHDVKTFNFSNPAGAVPGENEDGDGCCLPGFYRETADGPCILATGGSSAPPVTPAVPGVAKDCAGAALVITAPLFPTGATRVEIERENLVGLLHTFEAPGTFADAVVGVGTHRYRARACNGVGCSAWSAYSAPIALVSSLVPSWVSPAPGAAVGVIELVASAGSFAGLFATDPVSMRVFGGELPVTYHVATNTWRASFDTAMEYQGPVAVELRAKDVAGCISAPVLLNLTLDNSLERGARWSEKALDVETTAEMLARGEVISHTTYAGKLLTDGLPDVQRYFRWYVISPDPGAATAPQLADNAFMKNRVRTWQSANLNDVQRLITPAVAGATAPDHTARLAMESVATETMNLYALGAGTLLKVRQTQEDEAEILTSQAWFKFTKDGLKTVATFADYGITGTVTDGARVGDKIYLARDNSSRVVVLNTLTGKVTGAISPWSEERHVTAVENWNGVPFALYSNSSSATGYVIEGDTFDDPVLMGERVKRVWMRAGQLYLATETALLRGEAGTGGSANLEVVRVLTSPAIAWQVFDGEDGVERELGDEAGSAFSLEGEALAPLASALGGPVADFGRFKGTAPTVRGTLIVSSGANVSKLFVRREAVYLPTWTLKDLSGNLATKTVGLARLFLTLRAPSGDPLKGGDAGLFSESKLVGFETIAGCFLGRIQQADVDPNRVLKGRLVVRQEFKRERAVKKPVLVSAE